MKPKSKFRASSISSRSTVIFASVLATAPALHAADLTWDGGNTANGATIDPLSGNWNTTAGNIVWNNAGTNVIWSQTSTTDGSNAAVFAGADGTLNQYVVTLGAQMAAESITFNNSGYQITGSTLTLMPTTTTSGSITVAVGKTATINSILRYAHNTAASVVVGSGGVLNLGGGTTASNNPQFSFTGAGTVNITAGTYASNIGSVGNAIFNQTGGIYNITPGNNAGFNITSATQNVAYNLSAGTLSVNGNNTTVTVNNSFLAIGNGTSIYTSALNVSGTSIMNVGTTASTSGEIRIGNTTASNGAFNVSGGTVTVGTGSTANKIYFFKAGSGAAFTAAMTQSGGTVTTNGIQFGGSTGATTYDATSAANLTLTGGTLYIGAEGITKGTDAASLATTIKLEAGTLGADQNWSSSLNMQLGASTIRAQNAGSNARNITLSGILSDVSGVAGTLTKTGAGTLTLSGANTFTGGLIIKNGTVNAITHSSALGAGMVTLGGVGSNGATLTVGRVFTNSFTVNAPDSGSVVIGANGAGSGFTLSGGITLNGNLTIRTFDNTISGSTIASGSITGGITGTGNVLLNNLGLAANTLTFTTAAINHTGSLTLQGTAIGVTTIGSNIGANVTSVTQNSATSRLVLAGTNTYTGATNINAGIISVNGSLANTTTTVGSGGTLEGSGRIVGSVTVLGGGKIAAGNSIESLETGALTLQAGSSFVYEMNNDAASGVAGDLTAVTGNLTLDLGNAALLTLSELGSGVWGLGDKLTLISYSGTWNGGLFSYGTTLADDSIISFSGTDWIFNYNDIAAGTNYTSDLTGNRFVTMTAVPEPSTTVLAGSLGMLALLLRRRN